MIKKNISNRSSSCILPAATGEERIKGFMDLMKFLHCPEKLAIDTNSLLFQRRPNFELVANLSYWLMQRYDAAALLSSNIAPPPPTTTTRTASSAALDSEFDRIQFVKGVVLFFHDKANIQLDAAAIYAADETSILELEKVAKVLVDAVRMESEFRIGSRNDSSSSSSISNDDTSIKRNDETRMPQKKDADIHAMISLEDIHLLMSLSGKLTESAARLHKLLGQEAEIQNAMKEISCGLHFDDKNGDTDGSNDINASSTRNMMMEGDEESKNAQDKDTTTSSAVTGVTTEMGPRTLQLDIIEGILTEQVNSIRDELSLLEEELEHLRADKSDVLYETNNRKKELERNYTRLQNLEQTRPSFMDEYDSLALEFQKHYELYMTRYRNIHYLRHELQVVNQKEEEIQEKVRAKMMELQAKLEEEQQQVAIKNGLFTTTIQEKRRNDIRSSSSPKHDVETASKEKSPPATNKAPLAVDHQNHINTNNHQHDEDESTCTGDKSSALVISQCSTEHSSSDKSTELSLSRTTISVDSSTYFMAGPDFQNLVSPTSKSSLSGDESDDNF